MVTVAPGSTPPVASFTFPTIDPYRTCARAAGDPIQIAASTARVAATVLRRIPSARRPALFARVGFELEARRGLEALPPSEHAEGIAAVTQGLLALRQQQIERATRLLRAGLDLLRGSGELAFFFATEALAAVAAARGDVDRSIRLLSDAAAERPHTYSVSQWTAAYWIRMNTDLVKQCRRAGRHEEADRVSGGLRQILDVGTR